AFADGLVAFGDLVGTELQRLHGGPQHSLVEQRGGSKARDLVLPEEGVGQSRQNRGEPPEIEDLAVVGGECGAEVQRDIPRLNCPGIEPQLDAAVPGGPDVDELGSREAAGGPERRGQDGVLDLLVVKRELQSYAIEA